MRNNIFEGRNDYKAMIDAVLAAVKDNTAARIGSAVNIGNEFRESIKKKWDETVQKIKPVLKKDDRIMWYLRFYRQHLISLYLNKDAFDPVKIQKIVSDYERKIGFAYDEEPMGAGNIFDHLEHFLSLPIPEIQNYQFKNQPAHVILGEFEAFEQEWKKTVSSMFVDNDSEIIIDFKNGWYWINTKTASCSKEAAAMGHCGNRPRSHSNDQLLSLRKGKEINGDRYWEPHLTFILNDDGKLTEMKGKGNDKPSDRYHDMIIALLLHPMIHGILGGGYLPQNNFSVSDLPDDKIERLLQKKPELADASLMFKLNGYTINREITEKIIEELETLGTYDLTKNLSIETTNDANGDEMFYIIVESWSDIDSLARDINDQQLEQIVNMSDEYFVSVADWLEEKDAYKAIKLFIEEPSDGDIEQIDHLTSMLENKLGVNEEQVLDALFHVFPKSMQSLYEEWRNELVESAKTQARNYVENINWAIPSLDLRHRSDAYYLRVDAETMLEMIDDYNGREGGYSDGYLENAMHEGWSSISENDNDELTIDVGSFYSKNLDQLIERIIDLFETDDQLSFDFG